MLRCVGVCRIALVRRCACVTGVPPLRWLRILAVLFVVATELLEMLVANFVLRRNSSRYAQLAYRRRNCAVCANPVLDLILGSKVLIDCQAPYIVAGGTWHY